MQNTKPGNVASPAAQASDTPTPQDVLDQAQQLGGKVSDQAQDKLSGVAEQVKQQASSRLSTQIDRASEGIGVFAQTLQSMGGELREKDQPVLAQYTDRAAEQVQRAAGYLRGKNVDQLMSETEGFARRQPVAFIAGAFAIGILGARFLKSSGQPAGSGGDQLALPSPDGPPPPPPVPAAPAGNA